MIDIKGRPLMVPVIQGGMGIGVSLGSLAGAVAGCGGMGVISSANTGFASPNFWAEPLKANLEVLKQQIDKAKKLAGGKGLVALNAMVATTQYAQTIGAAVAAGIDAIISGAGLATDLPALTKGSGTALAPIVSSAKAARTICRLWDKRHGTCPDFVIIEGPEAGGHLGFQLDELQNKTTQTLEQMLPEVLAELQPYEEKYQRNIPVFVAGGLYSGDDIARFMGLGASGAQIATRFIATDECDASQRYKEIMVAAKEQDICLVKSPVGMPGRALRSPLVERISLNLRTPIKKCIDCLRPCSPATTPYCITSALIAAVQGNWEEGLFFCGSNVHRINRIMPVRELMEELKQGWWKAE